MYQSQTQNQYSGNGNSSGSSSGYSSSYNYQGGSSSNTLGNFSVSFSAGGGVTNSWSHSSNDSSNNSGGYSSSWSWLNPSTGQSESGSDSYSWSDSYSNSYSDSGSSSSGGSGGGTGGSGGSLAGGWTDYGTGVSAPGSGGGGSGPSAPATGGSGDVTRGDGLPDNGPASNGPGEGEAGSDEGSGGYSWADEGGGDGGSGSGGGGNSATGGAPPADPRIPIYQGQNQAMGGIALGAHGIGIPAGSYRPAPIQVPYSSGSSTKTEYSYNQWWYRFGPSLPTDHTMVKSVGCLGVVRAYAGNLGITDSPARMFYDVDPEKSLKAAIDAANELRASGYNVLIFANNYYQGGNPPQPLSPGGIEVKPRQHSGVAPGFESSPPFDFAAYIPSQNAWFGANQGGKDMVVLRWSDLKTFSSYYSCYDTVVIGVTVVGPGTKKTDYSNFWNDYWNYYRW